MRRVLAAAALAGLVLAGCSSAFGAAEPTVQPSPLPAETLDGDAATRPPRRSPQTQQRVCPIPSFCH